MKKIGVIGDENLDFILYLTSVIKNLDKKVAVRDSKKNLHYYNYVKYEDKFNKKLTYNDIDFYIDGKEVVGNYDIVLETFNLVDFNYDEKQLTHIYNNINNYDVLILLSKQNKLLLDIYNKIIDEVYEKANNIIVFELDIVNCKIEPKNIVKELKIDELNKVRETHTVFLEEKNIVNKINLQYGDKVYIKGLTKEYIDGIKSVVSYIFEEKEIGDKEIKKAIAKSKKGV